MLGSLQIRAAQAGINALYEHCRWVMDAVGMSATAECVDKGMLAAPRCSGDLTSAVLKHARAASHRWIASWCSPSLTPAATLWGTQRMCSAGRML
jgi:hypothetical protein